ncbi:unnamed protein product [Darwinula stevensoni]|uniref:C2H2-type domain-containing protein n=1 Tax=Darwinula stevensoni TaxID=69355 RepID=A0A7R9A1I9_9CRUS|nr:unnamed protein product [Darwinula stevensoni]CAG0883612.1 unnamed protein product [Darwinula stevensoni]
MRMAASYEPTCGQSRTSVVIEALMLCFKKCQSDMRKVCQRAYSQTRFGRLSKLPHHLVQNLKDLEDNPSGQLLRCPDAISSGNGNETDIKKWKCHGCARPYVTMRRLWKHYQLHPSHGKLEDHGVDPQAFSSHEAFVKNKHAPSCVQPDPDKNRGKEKEDDCSISSAGKKRKISCENAPGEGSENDLMSFLKSCDAVVLEERVIPCLLSRLNLGLWFIYSTKGKDPLRGLWDALQDLIILVQAIRNAVELSFALCEGNDQFSPEKTLKVESEVLSDILLMPKGTYRPVCEMNEVIDLVREHLKLPGTNGDITSYTSFGPGDQDTTNLKASLCDQKKDEVSDTSLLKANNSLPVNLQPVNHSPSSHQDNGEQVHVSEAKVCWSPAASVLHSEHDEAQCYGSGRPGSGDPLLLPSSESYLSPSSRPSTHLQSSGPLVSLDSGPGSRKAQGNCSAFSEKGIQVGSNNHGLGSLLTLTEVENILQDSEKEPALDSEIEAVTNAYVEGRLPCESYQSECSNSSIVDFEQLIRDMDIPQDMCSTGTSTSDDKGTCDGLRTPDLHLSFSEDTLNQIFDDNSSSASFTKLLEGKDAKKYLPMAHWFHRNPFKATAPVEFHLPLFAAEPQAVKLCSELRDGRNRLLKLLPDTDHAPSTIEDALWSYISLLQGFLENDPDGGEGNKKLRHEVKNRGKECNAPEPKGDMDGIPQKTRKILKESSDESDSERAERELEDDFSDPLIWWNTKGRKFPKLCHLARKTFCILATTIPCVHLVSSAGLATLSDEALRNAFNVKPNANHS